jgi:GNAT superfamily N-acetyltransferase
MIRPATPDDALAIARLHHRAWVETYPGLLPQSVIDGFPVEMRADRWTRILASDTRVALAPGAGFAAMGAQRDADLAARGYPEELFSIYLLRAAQGRGLGRALVRAVWGGRATTALVLEGNPACAFYEATGAAHLETRDERIGDAPIRERVYAWDAAGPRSAGQAPLARAQEHPN